ncbi:HTH_Tnp_Tc3_2 domain-containing protein [Trichonephila clavipes]|nr:HTH_Tnp_Tc3_2 domain-containing protein [Trichonephila clavipes]
MTKNMHMEHTFWLEEARVRLGWNETCLRTFLMQTQRSVADAVGVARSVVARQWNRFQETGNVRHRPGAGRPRATTSTDDGYIQLTARRNRTENATQLQRELLLATGRRVSSQTVRNRLHEGGLYARRPMVCIPLTPHHRAARRRWTAEHPDWE